MRQMEDYMEISRLVRNCWLTLLFLFVAFASPSMAAITTALEPSVTSPAAVGTVITWTANATDVNAGSLLYRFSAGPVGRNVQIVKDFSPSNTLDWTTIDSDGVYVIEVAVLNQATGEITYSSSSFELRPLATDNPVVTPTANPLVF